MHDALPLLTDSLPPIFLGFLRGAVEDRLAFNLAAEPLFLSAVTLEGVDEEGFSGVGALCFFFAGDSDFVRRCGGGSVDRLSLREVDEGTPTLFRPRIDEEAAPLDPRVRDFVLDLLGFSGGVSEDDRLAYNGADD